MHTSQLRVAVSVLGRFHAFQLAAGLASRGALAQLLTTYPRFKAVEFGVPPDAVTAYPALEAIMRAWGRLPAALRERANAQYFFAELYDRFARDGLRDGADVFVGWSGASLHTLRRARALGMTTVLERGSSHIALQTELLREEFRRFGLVFDQTHPRIIDKEMAEYDEADYIAVPSRFAMASFVERGTPEAKLIYAPYGVDLGAFEPVAREDAKFRVIYCGALSLQKGIPYLLEAFASLNLPDAELWLVGAVLPEMAPTLARYADARVRVFGSKPQGELKWYYSQCDLFCLPSIQDGFGMVLAQAMACGLPVVGTTNTGTPDLVEVGREGFVIPIRDARALADKIALCHGDRERTRAMGEAARRRVTGDFSWSSYAGRLLARYEEISRKRLDKLA